MCLLSRQSEEERGLGLTRGRERQQRERGGEAMAKRLLLDILIKVLGEYIELSEENFDLNLAVWSGQIRLHDLRLKTDKLLRNFNLSILHGSIKTLEVIIPWTALLNSPVKIVIDGVYLQVGPLDVAFLDKEETRKRVLGLKQQKLRLADKVLDFRGELSGGGAEGAGRVDDGDDDVRESSSQSGSASSSYIQALTTKIVDNLEIKLRNIHVRLEDSTTIPGITYAAGITLSSFTLSTCDEHWVESFVARSANAAIHKLAKVENLGLYWNTNSTALAGLAYNDWVLAMHDLINRSPVAMNISEQQHREEFFRLGGLPKVPRARGVLQYILAPVNRLAIKLVHNEKSASGTVHALAKYDMTVESTNLMLALDGLQYRQLFTTLEMIGAVERKRQPYSFKPLVRPSTPESARSWWRYACKLAIKRPRYVHLVKLSKSANPNNPYEDLLSSTERAEMVELEERLPLNTLIIFRHMASREMDEDSQKRSAAAAAAGTKQTSVKKKNERTWAGWLAGEAAGGPRGENSSKATSTLDDSEIPISSILKVLEDTKDKAVESIHATFLSLKLTSSASLDLTMYDVPIASAYMSLSALAKITTAGATAKIDLSNILAVDRCTPTPAISSIITIKSQSSVTQDVAVIVQTSSSRSEDLSVVFDSENGKSILRISSLPLQFVLNKICVQHLIGIFYWSNANVSASRACDSAAEAAAAATAAAERMRRSNEDNARAAATSSPQKSDTAGGGGRRKVAIRDDAFEFIFEAHAPKIIVPEDSSCDQGYLLLDTGYLKVRGFIGQDGMQWAISLQDVNAGMPLSAEAMYSFGVDGELYLIKPFDISLMIQNIDKTSSDISVDVDVKPSLRGELDKPKLSRLLVAIRQISDMFFAVPDLLRDSVIPASSLYQHLHLRLLILHPDLGLQSNSFDTPLDTRQRCNTIQSQASDQLVGLITESTDEQDVNGSRAPAEAEESFPEIIKAIEVTTAQPDLRDPLRVKVEVIVKMPAVALDLAYDVNAGNHLVLEMRTLVTRLRMRAFDMQIDFDLSELSIEDSNRCMSQRDLARTPSTGPNLIHIAYTYNYSKRSPCFKLHATEIVTNFANLGLNLDVKTIMHLRPFMEVLLARRPPAPQPVLPTYSSRPNSSQPVFATSVADAPLSGMHMIFTLERVSLDILRPSESGKKEEELESAFSLQIEGLRADLDMQDLTRAEVRLRSIEIIDIRNISRDYAIKRVFCPVFEIEDDPLAKSRADTKSSAQQPGAEEHDLLHLIYYQESKQLSNLKLTLLDMSCFVSTDTLLDLTAVASANFWAILELVSIPQLPATSSVQSTPPSPVPPNQSTLLPADPKIAVLASINSPTPSLPFRTPPSSPSASNSRKKASISDESKADEYGNEKKSEEEDENDVDEDDLSPAPLQSDANLSEDDDSNDQTLVQHEPTIISQNTMIISVKAINPRLVLLDDPTTEESQAMVGRCGIDIHWTRDLRVTTESRQLRESLHMSMKNLEVFVLRNMTHWSPQPVLEPLGVEYNMRRESVDGQVVRSNVTIGTDNANARVSISDLALSQSIFLRRSPIDTSSVPRGRPSTTALPSAVPPRPGTASSQPPVSDNSETTSPGAIGSPRQAPSTSFSFHLGMISLVAVNDFNGQNVPVARMLLEETKFSILREDDQMHGEGDVFATADFFNSVLSVWEPILDRWHPELSIKSGSEGIVYDIKSDHTMQITVSGIMLETLLQTYSLLLHFDDATEREIVPDLVVDNLLGEPVGMTLHDSESGAELLTLDSGQSKAVPKIKAVSNKAFASASHLPTAINIHFSGSFGSERMPLYNLPLNINKPRAYHLQTVDADGEVGGGGESDPQRVKRVVVIEPIVEEVYENSRYDPISGRWRQPFLLGDPHEWTDASTSIRKDISSIKLTSDRWEWQDAWGVDMKGMVEEEFDQDGWEYSTAFGSFSIASYRRNKMPMDCVRRRRWIRTRVPTAASIEERHRPLSLFWEVRPLKNGAKRVLIRSGMQVLNSMPFSIIISLSSSAWKQDREFGPIAEGNTFCVPLLCSYATSIKVRPFEVPYEWSKKTPCSIQAYDFRSSRDLICEGPELSPVCLRILLTQVHKSLLINLIPYVTICNRLPCDLHYRCVSSDRKREEGELLSGAKCKLAYINLASWPRLFLTVGADYAWSLPITLETSASSKPKIIELPTRDGFSGGLVITMASTMGSGSSMDIDIYCKSVLIDRTGLGISIWSQKRLGEVMMRHTFSRAPLPKGAKEMERKHVSNNVKKRLKQLSKIASKGISTKNNAKRSMNHLEGGDVDDDGTASSLSAPNGDGSLNSRPSSSSLSKLSRRTTASSTNLFEFGDEVEEQHLESLGYAVQDVANNEVNELGDIDEIMGSPQIADDSPIIADFSYDSKNVYTVTTATIGDAVYSDSNYTWSFIPHQLRGHAYICTASDDKWRRSKSLITFTPIEPALILLLVDMRVKRYPLWLQEDGFRRVVDQAIARRVHNSALQEIHFAIFGKYSSGGQPIVLRGNWCKEVTTMYTAFVVPAVNFFPISGSAHSTPDTSTSGKGTWVSTGGRASGFAEARCSLLDQVTFDERYERLQSCQAWIDGGEGKCMFYAGDDVISIGLNGGSAWSEDIRISMTSSSLKGSFEAVDWDSLRAYQLSYQMRYMPGLFTNTQQITITPRYSIVNLTDEELLVVQRGSRDIATYRPYIAEGWHKSDVTLGTSVQLRCRSSLWSLGTVDINEIGNSVLHLPRRSSVDASGASEEGALVLHIEVKVAEPGELCSIVMIVWRASVESASDISIRNETNAHVTIMQADLDLDQELLNSRLFEVCVAPGAWVPFGWADPDRESNVLVTVGTTLQGPRKRIAKVSMLKAGELMRLPDNSGRSGAAGEVVLSVLAENGGRILRISRHSGDEYALYGTNTSLLRAITGPGAALGYAFNFSLASLGVSLIVEKPVRREFLSLYVDNMDFRYKVVDSVRSYEFVVLDLQVDNYSETVIHSVLLYCAKEEEKKENDGEEGEGDGEGEGGRAETDAAGGNGEQEQNNRTQQRRQQNQNQNQNTPPRRKRRETSSEAAGNEEQGDEDEESEFGGESETPVIQLSIVQEIPPGTSTPIFRYVAFRVLALSLEVDSATIQLLFTDLLNDLKYVSREQALALSNPTQWMDENNRVLASPENQLKIVDVYRSKMAALTSKMYFEKLIVHPMKITFTFVQAPFPRKGSSNPTLQSTAFNIFTSLAAVDRMQLKLKSFEVEDALESYASLQGHIFNKTLQDLQSQLAQIAGSLAVLGSPMGFARKVGGGVKDLFYEPYQGAVHSPHDFVVGLGKGTSSFFTNFVAGAMNSTVAFAGTASKGIGYLSGDGEYVRKRAIKRQRSRANRGGIMDGIMDGGESVMSGFTSGMSGLVTRPFEEARKTGASGFLKGIGLGLLGALVKPVMGLTDGAASVASGISNQVGKERLYINVRPSRALERSEADASDLVLAPLNLKAAYAQEFVIKRSKKMGYEDAFLTFMVLQEAELGREGSEESIILSEMYVYWRRSKSLWGRTWANISHCVFHGETISIMLYARSNGEDGMLPPEAVRIICHTREKALRIYGILALNAHRMGNPANMMPLVEVAKEAWLTDAQFRNNVIARRGNAANLDNELDGYRFGAANFGWREKPASTAQEDVLSRAERSLQRGYRNWSDLDAKVWAILWEWDRTHKGLNASRCCATIIINRSDSPVQITRVQMVHGRNVVIFGGANTGYEAESRAIMPNGAAVVFLWAFLPSPIEIGHLKADVNTAAFSATIASTQRESVCEGRGGFCCGFLEKTVSEWWSKYVLVVS